ncbi:MAG TPA: DUF4336 domain-containing protein [Abditibacterium sp.]|jgi:hypothetical protein
MLRQLHADLWVAEMPFRLLGTQIGSRSTIVRLPNGDLWVHSPIGLLPSLQSELEKLGKVRWIVAPNTFHYLHVAEWAKAFPDAQICAVPGLKPLPEVHVSRILGDESEPEWQEFLDQTLFRGSIMATEGVWCHRPSQTLILTDTLIHIPAKRDKWTRRVGKMLGVYESWRPSRYFKLSIRDRKSARRSVETILSWDFERIIIAHGPICETDAKNVLRRAYQFLLK